MDITFSTNSKKTLDRERDAGQNRINKKIKWKKRKKRDTATSKMMRVKIAPRAIYAQLEEFVSIRIHCSFFFNQFISFA